MQNVIKVLSLLVLVLGLNVEAKESKLTTSVSLVGMSMDYRETNKAGEFSNSEKSNFNNLAGCEVEVGFPMYNNSFGSVGVKG